MKNILFIVIAGCFLTCDNPFNVTPTDEDDLFKLQLSHDGERIVDYSLVKLKWSEIAVDGFKEYQIERRQAGDFIWISVTRLFNRITTEYSDKIADDEDMEYRVAIMDTLGNIRWAESRVEIPRTRQLFVPTERETILGAVYDPLIDDGDTVWVRPGTYRGSLNLLERDIVLISTEGHEKTILLADSDDPKTVIHMNMGIVDGFTISEGFNRRRGGGVILKGTGILRRCVITNNSADYGGGITLSDAGQIINCIIYDNNSSVGSNIYVHKAWGKVINSTITFVDQVYPGTSVVFAEKNEDMVWLNNILFHPQNRQSIGLENTTAFDSIQFDYSLVTPAFRFNENGIHDQDPLFIGYPDFSEVFDFRLQPDSPCINSGHPDEKYNNKNGTRNTMGAYGGPYGQ